MFTPRVHIWRMIRELGNYLEGNHKDGKMIQVLENKTIEEREMELLVIFLKRRPDGNWMHSLGVWRAFYKKMVGYLHWIKNKGKHAGFEVQRLWLDRVRVFKCQNEIQVEFQWKIIEPWKIILCGIFFGWFCLKIRDVLCKLSCLF